MSKKTVEEIKEIINENNDFNIVIDIGGEK